MRSSRVVEGNKNSFRRTGAVLGMVDSPPLPRSGASAGVQNAGVGNVRDGPKWLSVSARISPVPGNNVLLLSRTPSVSFIARPVALRMALDWAPIFSRPHL